MTDVDWVMAAVAPGAIAEAVHGAEGVVVPARALQEFLEGLGIDARTRALGKLYASAGVERKMKRVNGELMRVVVLPAAGVSETKGVAVSESAVSVSESSVSETPVAVSESAVAETAVSVSESAAADVAESIRLPVVVSDQTEQATTTGTTTTEELMTSAMWREQQTVADLVELLSERIGMTVHAIHERLSIPEPLATQEPRVAARVLTDEEAMEQLRASRDQGDQLVANGVVKAWVSRDEVGVPEVTAPVVDPVMDEERLMPAGSRAELRVGQPVWVPRLGACVVIHLDDEGTGLVEVKQPSTTRQTTVKWQELHVEAPEVVAV